MLEISTGDFKINMNFDDFDDTVTVGAVAEHIALAIHEVFSEEYVGPDELDTMDYVEIVNMEAT